MAGFTIPDNDLAFNPNQSRLFAADIAIIRQAMAGDFVVSGCAVTAQGSPDMTVAVAVGVVQSAGASAVVTAGNATITTADATNPRIDLVYATSAGVKTVLAGTPAASPKAPDLPASAIALAFVYVPAADTTIATNQITDKRVIWLPFDNMPAPSDNTRLAATASAHGLVTKLAASVLTQRFLRGDLVWSTFGNAPTDSMPGDANATGALNNPNFGTHVHGREAAAISSSANQQVSGATDQYLTSSKITVPATLLKVGSVVRWKVVIDKTGAGVATPIVKIWVGTNGSTSDTAVATFTFLAQTGVIDTGILEVTLTCRGPLSASGIFQVSSKLEHNLTTTGLANAAQPQIKQATSGVFNVTTAGLFIGMSINPGASGVWNCQQILSEPIGMG